MSLQKSLFAIVKVLLISLVSLFLTRILILPLNWAYFKSEKGIDMFKAAIYGLQFDLSALFYSHAILILLLLFPIRFFFQHQIGKKVILTIFLIISATITAFNAIDAVYFGFTLKRSTADFFDVITLGDDTLRLIPQFILDYWFILFAWLFIVYFSVTFFSVIVREIQQPKSYKHWLTHALWLIPIASITVIAMRGGLQLKPIGMLHATESINAKLAPVSLNTPFTIFRTLGKNSLSTKKILSEEQLSKIYNTQRHYVSTIPFSAKNVIVIIMESFSKEYMGAPFGNENLTPFLDSLSQEGLFFDRCYANGKRSIDGIPAILSGIPSLMRDPYITSRYGNNRITSIPKLLEKKGYQSSFFHGGKKGTMGFDIFCSAAGIQKYYGKESKAFADDDIGKWGVHDGPFFNYFLEQADQHQPPFFSCFFSLSSHHPYQLPKSYNHNSLPEKHPLFKTVRYADQSLRDFFNEAKSKNWYDNTLFVITADHTAQAFSEEYKTQTGIYSIPLLFFSPNDTTLCGINHNYTQQIDILPTTLDYLNYDLPFSAFGTSTLKNQQSFAINYQNEVYQYIYDGNVLHISGEKPIGLYSLNKDPLMKNNQIEENNTTLPMLIEKCVAVIQTHNQALIHNKIVE